MYLSPVQLISMALKEKFTRKMKIQPSPGHQHADGKQNISGAWQQNSVTAFIQTPGAAGDWKTHPYDISPYSSLGLMSRLCFEKEEE